MKPNQSKLSSAEEIPGNRQDRPDAHDLLATTREALKPLLSDKNIDPSQRYTLLMAVRALGICTRELSGSTDDIVALTAQIVSHGADVDVTVESTDLDGASYADFVRRMRNGKLDSDQLRLREQLMQLTRLRLAISNPRYEYHD